MRGIGVIIVLIGVLSLLANFGLVNFDWEYLWPLVILAVGLIMEFGAFGGRARAGLFIPASILLTISGIFMVCTYISWDLMEVLWPLFILAPALGFVQIYLFGGREKAILIPAGVLSVVGLTFLFKNLGLYRIGGTVVSIAVIAVGLFLLLTSTKRVDRF